MMNKHRLGVQTKAAQPADEDFEFRAGELASFQIEEDLAGLRELQSDAEFFADYHAAKAAEWERLSSLLSTACSAVEIFHDRIQSGEFDQPEQPAPANQQEIEERHRALF